MELSGFNEALSNEVALALNTEAYRSPHKCRQESAKIPLKTALEGDEKSERPIWRRRRGKDPRGGVKRKRWPSCISSELVNPTIAQKAEPHTVMEQ
jgi:hypothetical protein